MEPSKDPISVRVTQLNSFLVSTKPAESKLNLISREGLLDALTVLYDECNSDCLKKYDRQIAAFVDKQRTVLNEVKRLRVNVSDFELKSVIGRGYFGEVYVVKEKQTGDIYAMKTVKKSECLLTKNASFEEERDIMACAQSPWLTSLQYSFQDGNYLYFIMEYHPGGDLLGLLHRQGGTIPESAASFYIAELVVALNDLHNMGYVHRDVKPDNILLDRCGHIKLADFGSSAKLNSKHCVGGGMPIGTPDYIAPEVLQSMDNKNSKKSDYGIPCDYWSVGVLAYHLTVGNAPFSEANTTGTYSRIISHRSNLKFPPEIILTQAYVSLIKGLLTEASSRLGYQQILKHAMFKNVDFRSLRDQVPPFVPKIESVDDTSNFCDVPAKKSEPNIENFKTKTQFSGKHLPFVGFTFTHDLYEYKRHCPSHVHVKDERVEELQKEVNKLQKQLIKSQESVQEKESMERKLEDKSRKLESLESLRNNLERDLANSIAECSALKRTLELERKERTDLERKAIELIKSAKQKWETSEKNKVESLNLELAQQRDKIHQLTATNALLNEQLQHALQVEYKNQVSVEDVQKLSRQSIATLEHRLSQITSDRQSKLSELQNRLAEETHQKTLLQNQVTSSQYTQASLKEKLRISEENCNGFLIKLEANQKLIRELENKISVLEASVSAVDEHKDKARLLQEELLKVQNDQKMHELERKLKMEKESFSVLQNQLQDLKEEFNACTAIRDSSLQEHKDQYSKHLQQVQDQLLKTVEEKNGLELKLQEAKTVEISSKLKVQTLEDLLQRLESGVSKLESDCEKENVLKEQIERLEQQLIQVHESAAVEREELSQLKTKHWRMEKDISNAEIDKRIFKRELKEAEDINKQLTGEINELKAKIVASKAVHEESLMELSNLNDELANEIVRLKELTKHLESKLADEKGKCENEKGAIMQLRNEIGVRETVIATLSKDLEISKHEKLELGRQIEILETEMERLLRQTENSKREKNSVKNEFESCRQELQNTQLSRDAQRNACAMLESKIEELEKEVASYQTNQMSLNSNTEKLIGELAQAREEIQEAKKLVNEERSMKLIVEGKCRRLQEDVECLQKECASYKEQCIDYRQFSSSLTDEIKLVEEKLTDYEVTVKSQERQIADLMVENNMLKEEISEQLTHLNNVKESNYQLGQELAEFKGSNNALQQNIDELQDTLAQKSNFYREREFKANGIIQQQTKLIDFLQSKAEESKKKKTLSDKLFGHSKKENNPPGAMPLQYKELENLYHREREINRELQEEIAKLRSGHVGKFNKNLQATSSCDTLNPISPRTKLTMEKLAQSPSTQKNDLFRKNSSRRMYHNIPHRFESKLCTKPTKCTHCSNQIILGRNMKCCTECHAAAHPNCAKYLPKTCGVPQAFVKHYSDSLTKLTNSSAEEVSHNKENIPETVNIEGWVKIPVRGNMGWDRHYACLTQTHLNIYAQPPNNTNVSPLYTLELHPANSHGNVIIEPVVSEIDTPVATSDLPFVMKVEIRPNTTCWPPKSITLMTLSIQDKEKWFKALQATFRSNEGKYAGELVMKLREDLEVNCLVELNDTKLLGTRQGLYSYRNGDLLHIAGPMHIYQIAVLHNISLAIMIADENRFLITCDLNHLIGLTKCAPCSKPTLIFNVVNVNNLEGFHLFQASDFVKTFMLGVATARQLILMTYDHKLCQFIPTRILDTAEPTSCMLFTEHSLIVGANKFFEIDLMTFDADEFLDMSDNKLSQVLMCYSVGSFPIAIMQISKKPVEYLLCFHEFAVFVDEFGRCSRVTEIKWTRLPRAFYFYAPYLYIVQFSCVEVIKITGSTCNLMKNSVESLLNVDSFSIGLNNPQFLGNSTRGIYLAAAGEVKYVEGKGIDSDSVSISSVATEQSENVGNANEEDSEEFSFTSSMVQSLDDNTSDVETETTETREGFSYKQKKVTFTSSHTNL